MTTVVNGSWLRRCGLDETRLAVRLMSEVKTESCSVRKRQGRGVFGDQIEVEADG